MTADEQCILGQIIRKYLGYELVASAGGSKLRGAGAPLSSKVAGGGRRGRWDVSPSVAARIVRGERSVGPGAALRILADIKPNEADLREFLAVTHLDAFFELAAETYRQAGFQSALTRTTNMAWSGQLGLLSEIRRDLELQVLDHAMAVVQRDPSVRAELNDVLDIWAGLIEQQDFQKADLSHEAFHALLLRLSVDQVQELFGPEAASAFEHEVASRDYIRRLSVTNLDLHQDPRHIDTVHVYGYTTDDEWAIFAMHRNIGAALLGDDGRTAEQAMRRHYDWLVG